MGAKGKAALFAGGALAGLLALASLLPVEAAPRKVLSFYDLKGEASSIWFQGGTNAFPGLPLANVRVGYTTASLDSMPSSHGVGSYVDLGEIGQTGWGQARGGGAPLPEQQPQQADARFPGSTTEAQAQLSGDQDLQGQGRLLAGSARAKAGETSAEGTATAAGIELAAPSQSPAGLAPASVMRSAFASLLQGVNAFRQARGLGPYRPAQAGGGLTARAASSHTRAWKDGEKAIVSAEAAVEDVDLGGVISIKGVRSFSSSSTDGAAGTSEGRVEVTGASLGGIPVEITSEGVSLAENALPVGPSELKALSDQLNQVLAQAGFRLTLLDVAKSAEGPAGSANVRGLLVSWEGTAPTPDRQSFYFFAVLGAASADAHGGQTEAATASPSPSGEPATLGELSEGGGGGEVGTSSGVAGSGGAISLPAVQGTSPAGQPAQVAMPPARPVQKRGGWLVALYGIWQLSVLATLAAAIRAKMASGAG